MRTTYAHGAVAPGSVTPPERDNAGWQAGVIGEQGKGNDPDSAAAASPKRAHLTPRHLRLLQGLLLGPLNREEVDRITGASNGPDEVLKLRRQYGLKVPCKRHAGKDRDEHRVEFGVYRLTDVDRERAQALLATGGAT